MCVELSWIAANVVAVVHRNEIEATTLTNFLTYSILHKHIAPLAFAYTHCNTIEIPLILLSFFFHCIFIFFRFSNAVILVHIPKRISFNFELVLVNIFFENNWMWISLYLLVNDFQCEIASRLASECCGANKWIKKFFLEVR